MSQGRLIQRFIFLNQMAGPLFRELCIDLAEIMPGVSQLSTGDTETLVRSGQYSQLSIRSAPPYCRKSKLRRVLSWIRYSLDSLILLARAKRDTAVFLVSNPPFIGPVAWLLCKLKGLRYIVLVYDLHPDVLIRFGILKEDDLLARLWRRCNRSVWESADIVLTIGDVMARRLDSQFSSDCTTLGRVEVLPPWADTDVIRPLAKKDNPLAQRFGQIGVITVLYSGNLGISHDIDSILEACFLLRKKKGIHFLIIGGGERWRDVVDFQAMHQLDNLTVLSYQSEELLRYSMALGDISLVAVDEGAEGMMIPSKVSYYMAAGSAVVGVCNRESDLGHIIEKADCGACIAPRQPKKLAEVIMRIASDSDRLSRYRVNARQFSEAKLSRSVCVERLKGFLREVKYI